MLIRAKDFIGFNQKTNTDPIPFKEYQKVIGTSQNGEDGVLNHLLDLIKSKTKYFVEFGAWDGERLSNVAYFRSLGYNGIMFEGDVYKMQENTRVKFNIHNEFLTSENINEIFENYNVPNKFSILSIDIDSDDAYVFEGLDTNRFSPELVIVEYNPGLPNHIPLKCQELKENQTRENVYNGYYGANISALYDIAKAKGYSFVTTVQWNVIFIKSSLFDKLNIPNLTKQQIMETHSKNEDWNKYWAKRILNGSDRFEWVS